MSKRYFCTHFDINYTPHARSLAESLNAVSPESELFAFCMDDQSFEDIQNNRPFNVIPIHYFELESAYPNLLIAKNNRTRVEYFYTCSPVICSYVLSYIEGIAEITYLDADLYFFSNPEPIFQELGNASVGIIEHKFDYLSRRNKIYGNFNVGWITFRKDTNALACLDSWRNNCIDWCYQRLEGAKYADQKYLDYWQRDFQGVYVIQNIGANLGPWNLRNYKLTLRNNQIFVDEQLLIFYHFANIKQIGVSVFKTDLSRAFVRCSGVLKENIYIPYIKTIRKFVDTNRLIIAKKDTHSVGFSKFLRLIKKITLQFLFPDIIDLTNEK